MYLIYGTRTTINAQMAHISSIICAAKKRTDECSRAGSVVLVRYIEYSVTVMRIREMSKCGAYGDGGVTHARS